MKNVKRFLIICLCSVMVLNTAYKPIKAEASAEVGIIGGALAAAGVTLTFGQIALIVAAAGGCVYLYQNREAVAESLENYLESVAENVENGAEELKKWWDRAVLGYIAIDTAQDFIKDGVKDWIGGLYDGTTCPSEVISNPIDHYGYTLYQNGVRPPRDVKVTVNLNGDYAHSNYYQFYFYKFYDIVSQSSDYIKVNTSVILKCEAGANAKFTYYLNDATKSASNSMYTTTTIQYDRYDSTYEASGAQNVKNVLRWLQGGRRVSNVSSYLSGINNNWRNIEVASNTPFVDSMYSDAIIGGMSDILDQGHSIDDVNLPDLVIDGTGSICPDTTLTGEDVFAQSISDTMTGLQTGTMTWSDYVADVGVAAPTITLPDAEDTTATKDYVITDTGVSDVVIDNAATASPDLDKYKIQLRDFFPFCLPFDMVDFITVLAAEPETPVFDLKFPSINGETLDLRVDLSDWDGVAQLMRNLELLALIIGLCFKTRDIIRG